LQISAALGVAVMGGVFFAVAGHSPSPVSLAKALVATMLCVALSLLIAAVLSVIASRSSMRGALKPAAS